RGLLFRDHLPGDALPGGHVSGPVCDSAHRRLARAVGRDARRPRSENCAAAPGLSGPTSADLRTAGRPQRTVSGGHVPGRSELSRPKPEPTRYDITEQTELSGHMVLDHPLLNEGSAFSEADRRRLGLLGLLPYHSSSVDEQLTRVYGNYQRKDNDLERYI